MLVAFGGVLAALGLYLAFVIRIRRQTLRVVRRRGRVPASSASPFQIRSGEFPGTISIADYFHSLQLLGGSLSLQSLLTAVLERYGLSLALPFALLIPADLLPLDNRYLVKPKALAESLMSSVCLGGICVMAKEIGRHAHFELTADGENHQGEPHSAVDKMERGSGDARVLEVLGRQENVIEMDAVEMLVEKIKMKYGLDPRGVPREISPASLPGLRFGNTGLPYLFEVDQERKNEVMSTICNRLCGNVLLHEPGVSDSAFVAVVAGCRATTLEDFIELLEKTGHRVSMEIRTNITSMGIGLSVLDRHDPTTEALNVPMCFPIRTNIVVPVPKTGNAGSREFQRHTELVSLMTHAAVFVEIAGPIIQYAKLEWCLNVNGMTGFQGALRSFTPNRLFPESIALHALIANLVQVSAVWQDPGKQTLARTSFTRPIYFPVGKSVPELLA